MSRFKVKRDECKRRRVWPKSRLAVEIKIIFFPYLFSSILSRPLSCCFCLHPSTALVAKSLKGIFDLSISPLSQCQLYLNNHKRLTNPTRRERGLPRVLLPLRRTIKHPPNLARQSKPSTRPSRSLMPSLRPMPRLLRRMNASHFPLSTCRLRLLPRSSVWVSRR